MIVTILHVSDCPNVQRIADALATLHEEVKFTVTTVEIGVSADPALLASMSGSPTVLIDGIDPFKGSTPLGTFACNLRLPTTAELRTQLLRGAATTQSPDEERPSIYREDSRDADP